LKLMKTSQIKSIARRQLKGTRIQAFSVILMTFFIMLSIQLLEAVCRYSFAIPATLQFDYKNIILTAVWLLVSMLLLWPVSIGKTKYFLSLAVAGKGKKSNLFAYFSTGRSYFKTIVTTLITSLMVLCTLFFSIIPGMLLLFWGNGHTISIDVTLQLTGIFLLITASAVTVRVALGLALVPYLLVKEHKLLPVAIIRRSQKLMKGNRLRVLYLFISFIGWFFLCLFIVPIFYALPYYEASMAVLAQQMTGKKEQEEREIYSTIEFQKLVSQV